MGKRRACSTITSNHSSNTFAAAGYAERTLRKKRTVARAFARWTRRKQIAVDDLNDSHIAAFVARSPRRRKAHVKFELAVMRLFFEYLRGYAGLQRPPSQVGRFCCRHPSSELQRLSAQGPRTYGELGACLCALHPGLPRRPDHPNGPRIPGVVRCVDHSKLYS